MSIEQLRKIASSLSKLIEDNEKIALPILQSKLAKAMQNYPEDQTIGMIANITSKMSRSNKLFISRAELKDLYNKLYSRNTKFAEVFADELGQIEKPKSSTIYNRDGDDTQISYDEAIDPILANALNTAFGEKTNPYAPQLAISAKNTCEKYLNSLNIQADIQILDGNDSSIICNASFETPKGNTSVLIPIEILDKKALYPSVFIGNDGPQDLTQNNVKSYVVNNAGNKLNIKSSDVLKAISTLKNTNEISNVDIALTKLNASKEQPKEFFSGQVLMQKVAEEQKNLNVQLPKYIDPEIQSFAEQFENPFGVACFRFGQEKVKQAMSVIARKLNDFGFNNSQISVIGNSDNTTFFAVSINSGKTAFTVPIKLNNPINPQVLVVNGSIEDFSKENIENNLNANIVDSKAVVATSPLYVLKASELVNIVREAMQEKNYEKAEEALNILSESNDEKAYQTAFAIFTNNLGIEKTAQAQHKCNRIVKNAHSSHEICGHTNLPLHKTYVDKNGDCQPLYRKSMSETSEGAYFMNSKIFF